MSFITDMGRQLLSATAIVTGVCIICLAGTPAAAQTLYPGGVSGNITLWLKANTASNLTYNISGNVSAWQSEVSTYSVLQSTAVRQPLLLTQPNANVNFNFNPSIQFNVASLTALANTSATPDILGTSGTLFMVVNTYIPAGVGSSSCFAYMSSSAYRYQVKAHFRIQNGNNGTGYTADLNLGPALPYPDIAGRILVSRSTGPGFYARRNSTNISINNTAALYNPAVGTGLCIGSNSNSGGSEYSSSAIAEVITYSATLSLSDINKIESYLAVKYGITLDQSTATSYVSAAGTTIWDATANAAYANNIAGIGRDDSSGLSQKQSASVNTKGIIALYNGNTAGVFPTMNTGNTSSFTANNSFYIAGDNGGDTSLAICTNYGYMKRMAKAWKAQKTGTIGNVTIAVKTSGIPAGATKLLVSASPSFPDGSTTVYPLAVSGTQKYASFPTGAADYFTFAGDSLQFTASNNSPVCEGKNIQLTGTAPAGSSFQWSGPGGYTSLLQSPLLTGVTAAQAGTYSLTITKDGCTPLAATTVVTIYNKPVAAFTPTPHYGCTSDTVTFNNTSTLATAYSWQYGDGNGSNLQTPTHIYGAQGTYTVVLQASNAHCSDTVSQTISLLHPLQASFTVDDDTICQGQTVQFINASVGTTPVFSWDFGDGGTSGQTNPAYTFLHTGAYQTKMIITDFIGCTDSAFKTIIVDSVYAPVLHTSDTSFCAGGKVNFSVTGANNTSSLLWDFGDGLRLTGDSVVTHAYDAAGTIHASVTAAYLKCPSQVLSKDILVRPYPSVDLGPDTTMCPNSNPLPLSDTRNAGNAAAVWKWSTGDTASGILATAPGHYAVSVTISGCTTADSIEIRKGCYLDIPNSFTPNNDGINDYFFPRQFLSDGVAVFSLQIFNRWGETIFETHEPDGRGWDGRFNGIHQPVGAYIYLIDVSFKNGVKEHYTGNVTLLR